MLSPTCVFALHGLRQLVQHLVRLVAVTVKFQHIMPTQSCLSFGSNTDAPVATYLLSLEADPVLSVHVAASKREHPAEVHHAAIRQHCWVGALHDGWDLVGVRHLAATDTQQPGTVNLCVRRGLPGS